MMTWIPSFRTHSIETSARSHDAAAAGGEPPARAAQGAAPSASDRAEGVEPEPVVASDRGRAGACDHGGGLCSAIADAIGFAAATDTGVRGVRAGALARLLGLDVVPDEHFSVFRPGSRGALVFDRAQKLANFQVLVRNLDAIARDAGDRNGLSEDSLVSVADAAVAAASLLFQRHPMVAAFTGGYTLGRELDEQLGASDALSDRAAYGTGTPWAGTIEEGRRGVAAWQARRGR
jgi:hypothetical protein